MSDRSSIIQHSNHQAYDLLFALPEVEREWFLSAAREQEIAQGTVLVRQNDQLDALYLLIEGVLNVYHSVEEVKPLSTLGPGQIIGEMSFIENLPASATVVAAERCMVLQISFETLRQRMETSFDFNVYFQNALLPILSQRLRAVTAKMRSIQEDQEKLTSEKAPLPPVWRALEGFKDQMFTMNHLEAKKDEAGMLDQLSALGNAFGNLVLKVNEHLGDQAPGTQQDKETLGYKIQREMAPYMMMSNFLQRSYTKPRGYAGDYLTIYQIYEDTALGNSRAGELLDRCCLESPAVKAVKNRRTLLRDQIRRQLEAQPDRPIHITIFACGPAQELFDVYAEIENPERIKATLIDIDIKALAHVTDRLEQFPKKLPVQLHQENLIYLALGKRQLSLPPQDLVYSIGLIDYFNDQLVVKLTDYAHQLLAPGGRLILGNFHVNNPIKAFMDYVLDWKLLHRSEHDMSRLFKASQFRTPCTEILYEDEGINMFACCEKIREAKTAF